MPKIISIITPVYNEELNVEICYNAVCDLFANALSDYDYELTFADNASSDRTIEILRELAAKDRRVKVILNARDFGPSRSAFNAIKSASGDAVITLFPADLQDPPEVIAQFVERWEEGYDVVYGVRKQRDENRIMTGIRRTYYRLVSSLSSIDVPPDVGDFQLIDNKVLNSLKRHDDYYPYIRGLIASCGFRSTGVPYNWAARKHGISKNSLYTLLDQGLNGVISLSNVPLRLSMLLGFFLASASIFYAFLQLILNITYYRETSEPGIATLITGMFFFSGVQLFFIGVIGEYIGAIHGQVRGGPRVVEIERLNFDLAQEDTEH